jgi:hypothetical protein
MPYVKREVSMNKEQVIRSRRRFEVAGSFACALVLGYALWNMSLRSDQEITAHDYLTLLLYTLLVLSCYLGAFWVVRRADPASAKGANLQWVYASIIGTSVSFTIESVRVWLRNRPSDLFGFIGFSVILLGIFVILALIVMATVVEAGVVLRWLRKLITGRGIEAHGI